MEQKPSPEQHPPTTEALIRYYNDCMASRSYVDLLISVESYLEEQFQSYSLSIPLSAAQEAGAVVDSFSFETIMDMREAKERFRLVPLTFAGPIAEEVMPFEAYDIWYQWAAEVAVGGGERGPHDDTCLVISKKNTLSCRHNGVCPLRVVRSEVTKDIKTIDAASLDYTIKGRDVTDRLVDMKLSTGYHVGILNQVEVGTYLQKYQKLLSRSATISSQ